MPIAPPVAPRKPFTVTRHGEAYDDPYAWLKDARWQEVLKDPSQLTPEIRAHLEAENAYRDDALRELAPFRDALVGELRARMKEDESTVPAKDGPWEYYNRYATGSEYPVYLRRAVGSATEQTLLDVAELAKGHSFCKVVTVEQSPDHKLLGYAVDWAGSERFTIRFRDAATGGELADELTDVHPRFAWGNDGRTIYYARLDASLRAKWVMRHRLGTPVSTDELLYQEADDGFFLWIEKSESQAYVLLKAADHATAEYHTLDASDPKARFVCLEARRDQVMYDVTHNGGHFYIQLHEGARKDGRIVRTPVATPGRASWEDVVAYQPGRLIQDVLMFQDHLVWLEMVDALPRIVVRALATGEEHAVRFDEAAFHLQLVAGYEFKTRTLRFTYSSMATPEETYDYDVGSRERQLRKRQEVPSGHNPADYEVKRLHCVARDGKVVPITLLRHKTHGVPGAPLLLYGYGSYGRAMPASFSPHRLSLVDRGFTYAVAHVRGGMEKGWDWYESAKVLTKKHTFEDFIDCAEHLVQVGVTKRGQIIAHGGSAGGMLMGAVANMAPELFLAMIADVPFVDVLNTMWDKDLPLTPPEWPEWGNPITSKPAHDYIASYSPYDNVEAKAYPHLLVLAGLTDPRVTYWEPAKWVARLRERKTDANLLVMDVNMDAGHAGASGRFDVLRKVALMYGFALKVAGRMGT